MQPQPEIKQQYKRNFKTMIKDFWELTKPGVTFMVVISTLGGFYLGSPENINWVLLFHAVIGSWLVAGGTNALNQLIEKDLDAKMKRTKSRPLPAGRLSSKEVAAFALLISFAGLVELALTVNFLTCILAALTLASYVLIYTPMKRKSSLSTVVGAIPGALPALGGWTASTGNLSPEGWVLFAILFFWQLPHFLAIAWIYREDYERGGFPVLPVIDKVGNSTGLQVITNCLALLSVSLLPTLLGLTGGLYFVGAFFLGAFFLYSGIKLFLQKTNSSAKYLLKASIAYLPFLFILMFIDKAAQ